MRDGWVTLIDLKISVDFGENEKEPSEFLDCVTLAEKVSFDSTLLSDHFMPWIHEEPRSTFIWPIIDSALERTRKIRIGPATF